MKALKLLLLVIVSGTFVYSGLLKAIDPKTFLSSVLTYDLLSYNMAVGVALFLPYLEVVCGLALLASGLRAGAASVIALLLFMFLGFIVQAYFRGLSVDCGCFGPSEASSGADYAWLLIRDFVLLACLGGLLWLDRRLFGWQVSAK